MSLNVNRLFSINTYVLTSLLVILAVSIPAFGWLRVPLVLAHILFFYLATLSIGKKIVFNKSTSILFAMLFYVVAQNLILQKDFIVVVQSMVMIFFIIMTTQISQLNASYFHGVELYKKNSKTLLFVLPVFCVSFSSWSESRQAGLFMNPNITAHLGVMLLPFVLLGLKTRIMKAVAMLIVLLIVIVTASRSGVVAWALSCGVFILISYFHKMKFMAITLLVAITTLISVYAVDIALFFFADLFRLGGGESRLLYSGYNGRDVLMEQALTRFHSQPWLGLGFDGAKFEIEGHELGTHNGFLDLLLRLGGIGTAIFAFYALALNKMVSQQEKKFKAVSVMSLVAISSLSANSSTFFVFNYLFLYTNMLICVGYALRNMDSGNIASNG